MANSAQARKRARQAETHRKHNQHLRSTLRTSIKKILSAITEGDKQKAQEAFTSGVPVIDRMADKGIIHKNKAARHKSRLNSQIRAMQ